MARTTWKDHFINTGGTISTSASLTHPWAITDTSSAGTPTYVAGVDNGTSAGIGHYARLAFSSTSEIQNVCLSFKDILLFNIDDGLIFETRIRLGQAALDTATSLAFGLAGDRNDALDSVAQNIWFRMEGGTSTTAVYYESDDGTTDSDDNPTSQTLTTGWKTARIDARDKSSIKFYLSDANGILTRAPTTLNVSAYAGCLQPYFQLQKTADTNVDEMHIDYVSVSWDEG